MSNKNYIIDIQILRATAVILVVIHHLNGNLLNESLSSWFIYFGGWTGVDLFFCISGFVISRSFFPSFFAEKNLKLKIKQIFYFWKRRALRLFPSAWLWLLIILIFSIIFKNNQTFGDFKTNLDAAFAGIFQFANIRFLNTFGQSPYGASFSYWSLSLEEQFYFILPLLTLIFNRKIFFIAIIFSTIQLLTPRSMLVDGNAIDFILLMFRTDAIFLGVALGMLSLQNKLVLINLNPFTKWIHPNLIFVTAVILLIFLGTKFFPFDKYRISLIAIVSGSLVIAASHNKNLFIPPFLTPAACWIGDRSYAIYLIHIPAFFLTRELFILFPNSELLANYGAALHIFVAILIICIFADLNYRFIEIPFISRNKRNNIDFKQNLAVRTID